MLQESGIQRQAYHGGAFVGNHIQKALTSEVIDKITEAPKSVVSQRFPALAGEADNIGRRFKSLMNQYASCRDICSSSAAVNEEQLAAMDSRIQTLLASARREVVDRHLLEDHVVDCSAQVWS